MRRRSQSWFDLRWRICCPFLVAVCLSGAFAPAAEDAALPEDERQAVLTELQAWRENRDVLREGMQAPASAASQQRNPRYDRWHSIADADAFYKGIDWALRCDEPLSADDVALIRKARQRAGERRVAVAEGESGRWLDKRSGKLACGYVSSVDGSTQPFGLVLPKNRDGLTPLRLDVVLHGSSKPVGMSELRFLNKFDGGDNLYDSGGEPPDVDYIELHPLGRVENCYRWSGETDVFEAIEAVCQRYNIDRKRIVLRGMSMGASGTWHLGLKHPDVFAALGPYCGYVDTLRFSRTPLPNFVVVENLPPHQTAALHMLDSVDYAANAGIVPCVAAMGEKDIFFEAHVIMGDAMRKEGLEMVNLISPGTGHVIDPATHAEQMERIGGYASKGLDSSPTQIRGVTWTLKYPRFHWLKVTRLQQHYERAEINAKLSAEGTLEILDPLNIDQFEIDSPRLPNFPPLQSVTIAGKQVAGVAPFPIKPGRNPTWELRRTPTGWAWSDTAVVYRGRTKSPGLQGPIDDAFCQKFLCVRGTGQPWNKAVNDWSKAALRRFEREWTRYFRGDLPVKDDTEVTADDRRHCNLVLFGDPGANRLLADILPQLPLTWTRETLAMNGEEYPSADHAPMLIQRLDTGVNHSKYVVLNSGHTFHEAELAKVNYLLFPRLGDWAVVQVGKEQPAEPASPLAETVLQAGFFDEQWRFPAAGP